MKFRSILFTLFATFALALSGYAQTARQVLDATAAKLRNSGGIEASFEATQFRNLKPTGSASGRVYVQGNKFKIDASTLTTWYDGRTQWTLLKGSDEVNVSNPTAAELQQSNPYAFIGMYKKGYNLKLSSTRYKGKTCHEVKLTAQSRSNSMQEVLVVIDKNTHLPLSIRVKDNHGQWTRIRVGSVRTGRRWGDSTFRYNQALHPGVQVIDLR